MATGFGGASGLGLSYLVFVTSKRNSLLGLLGVLLAASYVAMTLTGSLPLLLAFALINGMAQGFWPILMTVPF